MEHAIAEITKLVVFNKLWIRDEGKESKLNTPKTDKEQAEAIFRKGFMLGEENVLKQVLEIFDIDINDIETAEDKLRRLIKSKFKDGKPIEQPTSKQSEKLVK